MKKKLVKLNMRLLISGILLCLCIAGKAQSRLTVKAADSLDFILLINEVAANNMPCIAITLDNLPSGKMTLKASSPGHTLDILQTITLKKNSSAFYDIEMSKGTYKFVLKSESTLVIAEPTQMPSAADVTLSETVVAPEDSSKTHSGCVRPSSQEEYNTMLHNVNNAYFETRKLEVMKAFVSESCLRVEQVRFMMSRLSMEDNKFVLLRESLGHIVDTANLKLTEEDFFLEKNKARVHEMLSGQR